MKVFSNTTPFIALASIDRLDLLPHLFSRIPSFRNAAQHMREQGIFYNSALIERVAETLGE